jgi:hypothetical protein
MAGSSMRRRPQAGTATGRVWEIADDLLRRLGRMPRGREVVDAFVAEGGNEGTAFTQFSHWKKLQAAGAGAGVALDEGRSVRLKVEPGGRLVLPPEVLAGMGIGEDGMVTARLEDGELRLITPRMALRQLRAWVREFDKGEGSPVDELIRERRAEAARE